MTTTDTDTRALDTWLAKHLWGLELEEDSDGYGEWFDRRLPPAASPIYLGWGEGHGIPEWSTTGDGMLLVVEKLRERGWTADLSACRATEWSCVVWNVGATSERAYVEADTLPLAVALAARAALEAEEAARAD